jgi:hypothetical protein
MCRPHNIVDYASAGPRAAPRADRRVVSVLLILLVFVYSTRFSTGIFSSRYNPRLLISSGVYIEAFGTVAPSRGLSRQAQKKKGPPPIIKKIRRTRTLRMHSPMQTGSLYVRLCLKHVSVLARTMRPPLHSARRRSKNQLFGGSL